MLKSDQTQFSKDFYQTTELWAGYNIGRKWQVLAFVPYNVNKQFSDDGIKKSDGPGDISLMMNYELLKTRKGDKHDNMISQQLWVGGGIKMPTGKFNLDADDLIPAANNQAGTGSVDFILNAIYTYHINDWGINTNINYKINRNAEQYKFGNRLSSSAFIFHSISSYKTTFNPNVGVLYENLKPNQLKKLRIDDTGGNALLASGGMEISFTKMLIGFNAQLPITQNFSNNQTSTKVRGMAYVIFIF